MVKRGGTKRKIDKIGKDHEERVSRDCFLQTLFRTSQQSRAALSSRRHLGDSSFFAIQRLFLLLRSLVSGCRRECLSHGTTSRSCSGRADGGGYWYTDGSERTRVRAVVGEGESFHPQELMDAIKAMERVLSKLRSGDFVSNYNQTDEDLKNDEMAKSDVVSQQGTQDVDETLNLQAVCCVPRDDDLPEGFDKDITEEQDQILAICDSFYAKEDNNNINGLSGSLDRSEQVMDDHLVDIDGLIDFETTYESSAFDYGVLDSAQEH